MRKIILTVLIYCFIIVFSLPPVFAENSSIIKPSKSSDISLSTTCGTDKCHTRIYREWSNTMHAQSTPDKDPLVKIFYNYLSNEDYDTKKCDKCHAPLRAIYHNESDKNKELFKEGVNCIFCHSINGKMTGQNHGIDYYKFDFLKARTGPLKIDNNNVHETEFIGMFKSVDICAGCHQEGEANYNIRGRKKLPCQQCHMPSKKKMKSAEMGEVRDKVFRHLFEGGHSELLLSMSAIISGEARKQGGKTVVNITLENSARHPLPVGFPLRAIYMKVIALNKKNEPVWSNYKRHPYKEDPKSYFSLIFPEKEEVYAHAHWAKKIKPIKDTRLKPRGAKQFSYEVPSDKVESFQVQLYYRLLTETVIKKLKIDGSLAPEVLMFEETIYVY